MRSSARTYAESSFEASDHRTEALLNFEISRLGGLAKSILIGRVLEIKARASHQLESRLSESPES